MGAGDMTAAGPDPPQRDNERDSEHDSRRPAVLGLLVVLALVVAAYFLVTALRNNAKLEDCLMSGRRNCAPIEVPSRQ